MVKEKQYKERKFYLDEQELPAEVNLGPLEHLPGKWEAKGTGWNMIALPFEQGDFNYRVLMNQYNEQLHFSLVDDKVPNRGINGPDPTDPDQLLVTIDYQQTIQQTSAQDSPVSGLAGDKDLPIHHEPGLWLHMLNHTTNNLNIARLATVPHGDSALALGTSVEQSGEPNIPVLNGLPIGVPLEVGTPARPNPYLTPYQEFIDNPFFGEITPGSIPGFPGFHPNDLNEILRFANNFADIAKTTILDVDSTLEDAGIVNIPFIVDQANATEMQSTFWIQELNETDENEKPKLRLQYSQLVMLDFFERRDGVPGLIKWPHVSICTLEKVDEFSTAMGSE